MCNIASRESPIIQGPWFIFQIQLTKGDENSTKSAGGEEVFGLWTARGKQISEPRVPNWIYESIEMGIWSRFHSINEQYSSCHGSPSPHSWGHDVPRMRFICSTAQISPIHPPLLIVSHQLGVWGLDCFSRLLRLEGDSFQYHIIKEILTSPEMPLSTRASQIDGE